MTARRQQLDQYVLRLPVGWRDAIKAEARAAHRSMNGEILAAIGAAMELKGVKLPDAKDEEDRQGGHPDGLEQSNL